MRSLLALSFALAGVLVPVAATGAAAGPDLGSVAGASSRPAAAADYVAPPLQWGRCDDASLRQSKAKCAMLTVPLDYADPTGPTIQVAVARVAHTGKRYRGVMLTNPGGPGGEGRWVATLGAYVPGKVARSYDWIGIDPRGVGASRPALTCDGRYFGYDRPPYVPSKPAYAKAWLAKTEKYAADCGTAAAAALLPHVKTSDTVADFDTLRAALGAEKISYYGFSYGTRIGQMYATLHPDRVDKMVLDGVMTPNQTWYASNLAQDRAFEKVVKRFFAWVAKGDSTYHLGKTRAQVYATYRGLLAKLTKKSMNGVGPAELTDATLGTGYNVYNWSDTADALAALKRGDASAIKNSYRSDNPVGKGADNGYAMYLATQCTETAWPTDWATWKKDNDAVHKKAPYETWANAWYNMPCRTWPVPATGQPAIDGAALTSKILLISESGDAATPFSGALATRQEFPTASLIEGVGGTTHAASLYGIGCVDNRIARYLATGKTPKRKAGNGSDVQCPGLQPPAPADNAGRVLPHLVRPMIAARP